MKITTTNKLPCTQNSQIHTPKDAVWRTHLVWNNLGHKHSTVWDVLLEQMMDKLVIGE